VLWLLEANGGCASTINCAYPAPYPKESCPAGAPVTTNLHAIVIWGAVVLMAILGVVLRLPMAYGMRAWAVTRRPLRSLRCTRAGCWYQSNMRVGASMLDLAAFFLREMTMDFFPVLWDITAAEFLSLVIFLVGQVVAIILYGMAVKGQPMQEVVSRSLAAAAEVNFGVLLIPICRNSPMTLLAGTSFERTVKYHRILGRYTMILVLIHFVYSLTDYGLPDAIGFDPTCFGLGNGFGVLSFWSFVALTVFAHNYFRRHYYEVFKHTHWFFFLVGIVCACLHSQKMIYYVAPGLLFYFCDHLLRMVSWGSRGAIVVSATLATQDLMELKLDVKGEIDCEAGSYVFLNIPSISFGAMDFHPFTISSLEPHDTEKKTTTMTFHVKASGSGSHWTTKLQQKISEKAELKAYVEGPYGKLAVNLHRYKTIIASSGGIGVTPMIPLLRIISDPEARRQHMSSVCKMVWIWTVRDADTIVPFKEEIARAIGAAEGMLDVKIYVSHSNKGAGAADEKALLTRVDVAPSGSPSLLSPGFGAGEIPTFTGRPNWEVLYEEAVSGNSDTSLPAHGVCSLVCGPASLVLDVQNACADQGIHSHEETFAW